MRIEVLRNISILGFGAAVLFLGITIYLGWKWNIRQILEELSGKVEKREIERLRQIPQSYGRKFDLPIKEVTSVRITEPLAATQKLSENEIEDETCLLEEFSYIPVQQEQVTFQVTKTESYSQQQENITTLLKEDE